MAKQKKKPNIPLPSGFDSSVAFLDDMRREFAADEGFDYENHAAGVEDLKFVVGEQWDSQVRALREAGRKPVLTINRLPAFVAQVLGSRMQNQTEIKILPDNGGTKQVAEVREGLMRNIQKVSRAELAYDNAYAGAVMCGVGNFELDIDYDSDDVWDQSLNIRKIADHFSVIWDRQMTDPTGKDARHAYKIESMTEADFTRDYPWAAPSSFASDRMPAEMVNSDWFSRGNVRVVDYWSMREREREVALLTTGQTIDITDLPSGDPLLAQIASHPDSGEPYVRTTYRKYAQLYRCSATDVLEGPYDLPIDRIPIFRVPGWEVRIGDQTYRWGLIRFLKDPQRLHNYWRSVQAEKIMQSPKATWVASDAAVAGREKEWRNSGQSDNSLLIWNSESGNKPERNMPVQVEDALIAQASITQQDLKDVSNIHEANLGMPSNEVSGKAINARVRVSDVGNAVYQKNMEYAIAECGRVANQLVPVVYDTPRIVKIIGPESQELMQAINYLGNPQSVDITSGRYNVTATTGPTSETKRIEAAENMMALATAMPQALAVGADLIVEAQDWPGAEKIARRLRKALPPQLLSKDEITPEIAQAMQQQQKVQGVQVAAEQQKAMDEFLKAQSTAAVNFARANHYNQQAEAIMPKLQNETIRTASEVTSRRFQDSIDAINVAT